MNNFYSLRGVVLDLSCERACLSLVASSSTIELTALCVEKTDRRKNVKKVVLKRRTGNYANHFSQTLARQWGREGVR